MEITDIVGKEMIDIIGLLGTLTDEELRNAYNKVKLQD